MGIIYLFDVDGTLTDAKQKMDSNFANQFLKWMRGKEVYIVSGGSFVRILNQLGMEILDLCSGVFACMGNIFYQKIDNINDIGYSQWEIVYKNKFAPPQGLYRDLDNLVKTSEYHTKTGRHYEERVGMVNFSIVGREAAPEQRQEYSDYDEVHKERESTVSLLKERYTSLDFAIGGAVSIDIFKIGDDKSQIIDKYFNDAIENNKVIFFGDRIPPPGNDASLANSLRNNKNGVAIEVKDWAETSELLKTSQFA
jgi:phosphomannomutase|tara:strand:+ start:57952 stop:58710 length:759 start_codon:yes stop_codon:yes gene_type:complete